MDQHMSFEVHVHEMHKKVMGILLLLNRIRDKFAAATQKIVIQSFALSGVKQLLPSSVRHNQQHAHAAGTAVAELHGKDL